ncbi:MAG TPA: D-aminoacyl-tRNA deacylase [Myxococcaceae bacterium]|nr:D-aminoacyl-tRNA deacylase [Myxococcaceae bacterium]
MRSVVQRVLSASVTVDGQRVSEIGPGLLVLLGVGKGDSEEDVEWMARKVAQLRIFEDDAGKMNRSVLEGSRQLIAVSQFTLLGDARKGNRPSFIEAMEPEGAKRLYALFCERLRSLGLDVGEGVFAAHMDVALVNDGPVTILLDSRASS